MHGGAYQNCSHPSAFLSIQKEPNFAVSANEIVMCHTQCAAVILIPYAFSMVLNNMNPTTFLCMSVKVS